MQHGSLRAPVRVFMAAVLLCLSFLAAPKAAAAQLQDVNGITLLSFDSQRCSAIFLIIAAVSALTLPRPLSARSTVPRETPQSSAIFFMVTMYISSNV